MHDADLLDLDDGATEVVDVKPARRPRPIVDAGRIANAPAGGRMAQIRVEVPDRGGDFLTLRTPLGASKIAFSYVGVLHGLWRVWSAKRAAGEPDPGASATEVAEAAGVDPARVRTALTSLVRNRVARGITQHIGYQGTRARYYPTEFGVQALALAEVLGPGSAVQVGRTATAWRGRDQDEPGDLFQFAALVRGGAPPLQT